MIRYEKPDGTTFTLLYHEPAAWAKKVASHLRALECSDAYTEQEERSYAQAVEK